MKKDLSKRIERYAPNGETDRSFLGGHTKKDFVRIDDDKEKFSKEQLAFENKLTKSIKDSDFFVELFKDLSKGNSHYCTYMNSLIVGLPKEEIYIPKYVSCLLKDLFDIEQSYISECVGCRLANELGVNTVFNIAHERPLEAWQSKDEFNGYDYLISVDYIPSGYTNRTLQSLDVLFTEDSTLGDIMQKIDLFFKKYARSYELNVTEENLMQFKKDFARQYLFRQFVCEDDDFTAKNVGMLISENGDFTLAPCFDMEFLFYGKKAVRYYEAFAKNTIVYLKSNMPDVLMDFVNACVKAQKSGRIEKIFRKTLPNAERREIERMLKQTTDNIIKFKQLCDIPNLQEEMEDCNTFGLA